MKTHFRNYLAEFLGTFALTLAVFVSIASGGASIATPVIAAITLGLFVYNLGHASGAHFNPAVSLGLWSIGKINFRTTILYIISQFIGASLAMMVAGSFGLSLNLIAKPDLYIMFAELIGTFLFTFGIASVVHKKTPSDISGIAVGGSLLLGVIVAAALGSNGILNPAVAYGLGSLNTFYFVGPILGSILGVNIYRIFSE